MSVKKDNSGAVHVGDAIKELFRQYHIDKKFDEASIIGSWERLVGSLIAKHTKKVFMRNNVLFAELTSPSLKHDLNYSKSHILELFQKEFGKDAVKELVLM